MPKISAAVQRVLTVEEIEPLELQSMVERAALCSDERGNRRYHSWLFEVSDKTVKRMSRYELTQLRRPTHGKPFSTVEECMGCEGQGCTNCGWNGSVQINYQ